MIKKLAFAQKGLILDPTRTKLLVTKYLGSIHLPDKLTGKFCLPGGKLEFGQEPDESFVREVQEETGVIVKPLLPFYTWTWTYQKGKDVIQQIVANARVALYVSGEIAQPTHEEETTLDTAQWISIKQIVVNQFVHDEQPAIQRFILYKQHNPFDF